MVIYRRYVIPFVAFRKLWFAAGPSRRKTIQRLAGTLDYSLFPFEDYTALLLPSLAQWQMKAAMARFHIMTYRY